MTRVALIDYGAGNLRSCANALRAAGADDVCVTADPDVVARAERIVLPGVGAFKHCIDALRAIDGLVEAMDARVRNEGTPLLGICVGMQLLADAGEEHGVHVGLGWVGGAVRAFTPSRELRIPHMGWNDVLPTSDHPLMMRGEAYFLHSYALSDCPADAIIATSNHGRPFTAAVARGNVAGVQFHPEKSQTYGIALLQRFLAWRP